ncbi:CAP domain-containing protein [Sphingomonas sp.]|uniref:CAP domain-containing protein n=1 Tax=Sphingomonas sp. TaxID=28214 RepID=UPI00286E3F50|nr:CAP domain-containing protein [Sphingomonas sp.]
MPATAAVTAAAAPTRSLFPVTDDPAQPLAKPRSPSTMRFLPPAQQALQAVMMAAHNQARGEQRVAPLAWDDVLAEDAWAYAQTLARSGRFEHARQDGSRPRQGENLWVGTRGAFSYAAMIEPLIGERRYFRPGAFPAVSTTGRWSDVGHYTQIVWPATQRVGCATASSPSSDYLVCRYFPAGNVSGVALR